MGVTDELDERRLVAALTGPASPFLALVAGTTAAALTSQSWLVWLFAAAIAGYSLSGSV